MFSMCTSTSDAIALMLDFKKIISLLQIMMRTACMFLYNMAYDFCIMDSIQYPIYGLF